MAEGPAGKGKQTVLKRRIMLKIRIKMTRNTSKPMSEHMPVGLVVSREQWAAQPLLQQLSADYARIRRGKGKEVSDEAAARMRWRGGWRGRPVEEECGQTEELRAHRSLGRPSATFGTTW